MPTIRLSRGLVASLHIRYYAMGVRLIAEDAAGSVLARIVLNDDERALLVRALSGPDPELATVADLFESGYFAGAAGAAIRLRHDGDDRIQDAACQVWVTQERRRLAGAPEHPVGIVKWLFRRRVRSVRDAFVRTKETRGLDVLDPRCRLALAAGADPEDLGANGCSAEDLVALKELLETLPEADREFALRRVAGETLAEVAAATGTSTASEHRRGVRLRSLIRAA